MNIDLSSEMKFAVCDYKKFDIFVVDETKQIPLGNPWITFIYDKNFEVVLGTYIEFSPPSYKSVLLALKNAILTKNYNNTEIPSKENHWELYGIPDTLQIDNGMEFRSKHFEDVCKSLGIQLLYAPPRKSEKKLEVERLFESFNEKIIENIPSRSASNLMSSGERIPRKNVVFKLEELSDILHHWLLDVNSDKYHKGLDKSIEIFAPNKLSFTDIDIEVMFGMKESRTIQRTGIVLHRLPYNSIELHEEYRKKRKKEDRVEVAYNPDDLSKIYVFNKFQKSYIVVPCLDQEYSKNLPLVVHNLYLKEARELQNKVDMNELKKARLRLDEMIKALHKKCRVQNRWRQKQDE